MFPLFGSLTQASGRGLFREMEPQKSLFFAEYFFPRFFPGLAASWQGLRWPEKLLVGHSEGGTGLQVSRELPRVIIRFLCMYVMTCEILAASAMAHIEFRRRRRKEIMALLGYIHTYKIGAFVVMRLWLYFPCVMLSCYTCIRIEHLGYFWRVNKKRRRKCIWARKKALIVPGTSLSVTSNSVVIWDRNYSGPHSLVVREDRAGPVKPPAEGILQARERHPESGDPQQVKNDFATC